MRNNPELKTIFINFIKGLTIGLSMVVPGVSGGTMAIILGLYDRLIRSVGSFFADWKGNFIFLATVGMGGIMGILLSSRFMGAVIDAYPIPTQFLFMGIIVGGLPVLYKKSKEAGSHGWHDYAFFILGAAVVYFLSPEPETAGELAKASGFGGFMALFIAGIIIAVALVLPGISTSFALLALGLYGLVLGAVNSFNLPLLLPLLLGVAVGTLATTKAIEFLLNTFPAKSYMAILGFVAGALVPVFPGLPNGSQAPSSILLFVLGTGAMFLLGKAGFTDK